MFWWWGKYFVNMNDCEILEVYLNVFGEFDLVVFDNF